MKVRIEFLNDPNSSLELDCGNFGVERAPMTDGGPIVVTLIDSPDKQDPSANILGMYVGVSRITLINNEPYIPTTPRAPHAVMAGGVAAGKVSARAKPKRPVPYNPEMED